MEPGHSVSRGLDGEAVLGGGGGGWRGRWCRRLLPGAEPRRVRPALGRAKVGGGAAAAAPFSAPPNTPTTLPLPPPRPPPQQRLGPKRQCLTHTRQLQCHLAGGLCRLWCLAEAGLAPVLPHPSRGRAAPAKASAFAHFTFWATFSNAPPERRAVGGGEGGNDKQRPVGSCLCVPTARLLQSWSATDQCGAPAKTARHLGTTGPLCPAWDWTSLPGKPQPRAHGIAEDSSA